MFLYRVANSCMAKRDATASQRAMNILHATDRHNRATAGIANAANEVMAQTLAGDARAAISLVSIGETDLPLPAGVRHFHTDRIFHASGPWRYAPEYQSLCERIVREENIEVVHIHGVWTHATYAAARAAERSGRPSVLTNHGQLTPWALTQPNRLGALRKKFYLALMRLRLFHRIAVFHAITPIDRDAIHGLLPHARIEMIPNSLDLAKLDQTKLMMAPEMGKYILFVGRLHPIKGLDMLVEAFGQADLPRDWRLILAGPSDDDAYTSRLRATIDANPHAKQIELRGPVWDPAEKYALMRAAWAVVVPSFSEVISLVNLEAAACGTPSVTTRATGLFDWEDGGGVLVDPTIGSIAAGLSAVGRWSDQERQQRGRASRKLVEARYSTSTTAPRWTELYRSLS